VVLPDGTYMQANCCTSQAALLDPESLTWKPTGRGKYDPNDEEGWTLLPNGNVLTVDAYVPISPFPYIPTGKNFELYDSRRGRWNRGQHSGAVGPGGVASRWNRLLGGLEHLPQRVGRHGHLQLVREHVESWPEFPRHQQYLRWSSRPGSK
jgi:hypothetical protein